MKKRKKAASWVAVLSIVCGLIIWHIIDWYSTGMYVRLLDFTKENKVYLSVLYNLGLMILLSVTLGLLMGKLTDLLGNKNKERDNLDNKDRAG